MSRPCGHCGAARAVLRRPKTAEQLCRDCFFNAFESEVHQTIVDNALFRPGERVAIGASGTQMINSDIGCVLPWTPYLSLLAAVLDWHAKLGAELKKGNNATNVVAPQAARTRPSWRTC